MMQIILRRLSTYLYIFTHILILLLVGCKSNEASSVPIPSSTSATLNAGISRTTTPSHENKETRIAPTIEAQPKSTNTLESTKDASSTIAPDLLGENLILLKGTGTGQYYFLDIESGFGRGLDVASEGIVQVLNWDDTGCSLVAMLADFSLVEINLKGEVIKVYFSRDILPSLSTGEAYSVAALSPGKDWVIYRKVRGNYSFDPRTGDEWYDDQQLFAINLNDPEKAYPLSVNGGAYVAAWSSSDEEIFFLDYDDNEITQIFRSKKDGNQKTQVSAFTGQTHQVRELLPSPSGANVAIKYFKDKEKSEFLSTQIAGMNNVDLPDREILWWRDDHTIVLLSRAKEDRGIFLFDITSSMVTEQITLSQFTERNHIGYYRDPTRLGFYSEDSFVVYSILQKQFTTYPKGDHRLIARFEIINGWFSPPEAFNGEQFCNN